ncbi:serine hydrolase domain-containing protein [Chloroflexota bacterium]
MNSSVNSQYPINSHIDGVIHGLRSPISIKGRPPVRWTLSERMEYYHVPGVSLAIIDDGHIVCNGGFGVKKTQTIGPVKASTLFQAASISKPIAATAILGLVDTHKISLDEDINNYLKSWKIPENNYTVQEKVTLRRILSHSAGLTVHGFPGYSSDQPIPTLQQILDGEKPANTSVIKVDTIPGSMWRYSGGGFTVIQQLLIDMINDRFPLIMKQMVLERTGMFLSTFEQPLPDSRSQEVAYGHNVKGESIEGNWHIYPEMAAAGLWTTPTELARWALEITGALNGHTGKLLSKSIAIQMMTIQKPPSGLGILLEEKDKVFSFSHGGANEGFRSSLVMFPTEGKGAVIMTNGDQGGTLIDELLPSIAAEYHWQGRNQSEREVVNLEASQIKGLIGTYSILNTPAPLSCEISHQDGRLFFHIKDKGISSPTEIYASSIYEFFSLNGHTFVFTRDDMGQGIKINFDSLEAIRQ